MGGTTFMITGKGKTARETFNAAVEQARYECGHRGYTGTIAEKRSFVMISTPAGVVGREAIIAFADKLIDDGDPRVDDKWGPAGCIKLGDELWLFFGWASC